MHLNRRAREIVEPLLADPGRYGAACHRIGGAWVVDCGVRAAGGSEAGLLMARAALAGLATVELHPAGGPEAAWPGCPWPAVAVASREPVAACLAAQYAGWRVKAPGYFAMASGPLRAAIGREDLFDTIGGRERPETAVGLLEASALPPAEVCQTLAAEAGVPTDALVLLVARTASVAGTLQVVARSLETALHKLHDLHFDVGRIHGGRGIAPLPPPAADARVAPQAVSGASPAAGEPFLRLFERAGRDFYALDPALFAPACLELVHADTGRRHRAGRIAPEIVAASFAGAAEA
jgi:methenyltetrahydromethanopterin cyclohydrolase